MADLATIPKPITFNAGQKQTPNPTSSTQSIAQGDFNHPQKAWYTTGNDLPLMPLYNELRNGKVNLVTDSGNMVAVDSGQKGASVGANYTTNGNRMILSSDRSGTWWHDVPHEYAHYVTLTQKPALASQIPTLFKGQEDMADSYADYYNDPAKYAKTNPKQAQWFKTNFIVSPIDPEVVRKKTTVAKKMVTK